MTFFLVVWYSEEVNKRLGLLLILGLVFLVKITPVWAQNRAAELTDVFTVSDKSASSGDILITTSNGLTRATQAYDTRIFGILTASAVLVIRSPDQALLPVARNGVAEVAVTNLNGTINKGDYITSSPIAGKGQRAQASGYVIGTALESFDANSATNVNFNNKQYKLNTVMVALRIEYAEISGPRSFSRLFDYLGASFFSSVQDPNQFGRIVRYISASLVVLLAIAFALWTLSRSVPKAIEALGRNPLARRSIYLSMALTGFFVVFIIGVGILAAIVVLRV